MQFYDLANEYCHFISNNEISVDSVTYLIEVLMKLYISAMHLPDKDPETIESAPDVSETISIKLNKQIPNSYWEVFDPYVEEEPVCCDLMDDLSDIAKDLKDGISEYETGRIGNAVFEWKFGFNNHWGQHIIDALRALHAIKSK